jgi:heavy metal sensor kinase
MVRLSIRWRLILWNAAALAVVLLLFGGLVYGLLARSLYQRLDRSLLTELEELQRDPRMTGQFDERLRHWIYEFKEHENIFCVVYDGDGHVYQRTEELAVSSIPPVPALVGQAPEFRDQTIPIIGRQRTLVAMLNRDSKPVTVLLMAGLDEVDRELSRLLAVLATAVPIAVLVSAGFGLFLAQKALGPIQQLNRLTREITAERLDRRLPVANPSDELGTLTQTINAMIARLEQSFAEIRRFTADASHELRTPLTAIRTEAEVALRQPLNAGEHQQLLGSVLEECERLTRLTDQLLMLSRADAAGQKLAREPIDLAGLLRNLVETMRPLAEAKRLTLKADGNGALTVRGDESSLRQVFCNLVDNAIKYTPEAGTIEVGIADKDEQAVVTIRDTGIGIPPEDLPRVFDRFYRVDKARSRDAGGSGLGLSIARSIVAAHGGRIELTSTPGRGTTCTVILPSRQESDQPMPADSDLD